MPPAHSTYRHTRTTYSPTRATYTSRRLDSGLWTLYVLLAVRWSAGVHLYTWYVVVYNCSTIDILVLIVRSSKPGTWYTHNACTCQTHTTTALVEGIRPPVLYRTGSIDLSRVHAHARNDEASHQVRIYDRLPGT